MNPNLKQIEHWNGPAGKLWASHCGRNEYRLEHVQRALMEFAAPEPGMDVLDIGCGCGLTTLALAEAVSPGSVTGLDVSAPMLEAARAAALEAGLEVQFVETDASIHPFRPEFDLVFSRFGVMFFADPVAAFANIRSALKPGGRLAFACWRAQADNPWTDAPYQAALDLLPPQEKQDPHAPGQFSFADGGHMKNVLTRAGFAQIRIESCDVPVNMGRNADEAAEEAMNRGALDRATADLDEPTRAKILARVREVMARYATPEGVSPPGSIWLVSARN